MVKTKAKDLATFKIIEVFKGKPITGTDPVLLSLIKKAMTTDK
jgi:hypothetical protein